MPTLIPSDTTFDTTSKLFPPTGTFTDTVGATGFPALVAASATIIITYQLDVSATGTSGTVSSNARLRYSVDNGGSWSNFPSGSARRTIQVSGVLPLTPDPKSDQEIGVDETFVIGRVEDLSLLLIQGYVDFGASGDGSGSGQSQCSAWSLAYTPVTIGMMEA